MIDVVIALGAAVLIVGVIARQLRGEALRGRRLLVLPVVLIGYGAVSLGGSAGVGAADIACIAASALIALLIGLGQGALTHLELRDGGLWGRLPRRGLWLWAALVASRLLVTAVAVVIGAKAASSADSILLVLGINRLAQAGVITLRAMAQGIPFSPEKDGRPFLASVFDPTGSATRG